MVRRIRVRGEKLVALRETRFWSRADLAAKSQLGLSTVQRYEQDKKGAQVSLEAFRGLADAFGITPEELEQRIGATARPRLEVLLVGQDGKTVKVSGDVVAVIIEAADAVNMEPGAWLAEYLRVKLMPKPRRLKNPRKLRGIVID
jgi:transcriptional regulator with XRE-family HTH domain